MDFCSGKLWSSVSTCLSFQFGGQHFVLWPRFSEDYKKSCWFLVCPAVFCCCYEDGSDNFQVPCICLMLGWKSEVQFYKFFIVSYSHSFRDINSLLQCPGSRPGHKLDRGPRTANLVSSLQGNHFLPNSLSTRDTGSRLGSLTHGTLRNINIVDKNPSQNTANHALFP